MTPKAFAVGIVFLALIGATLGRLAPGAPAAGVGPLPTWSDAGPVPVDFALVSGQLGDHHDYPAADLPMGEGATVRSIIDGTARVIDDTGRSDGGRCGHGVQISGPAGAVKFCHGQRVTVAEGQAVAAGQPVMVSGWSGTVRPAGPAGAHLHVEIRAPGDPRDGHRCPIPLLLALRDGSAPPAFSDLPTRGCVS